LSMLLPGSDCMAWTPWLHWPARAGNVPCTSGSAVRVERRDQVLSDRCGASSLDLVPLEHVDQLAVLEEPDLRRRRSISGEIAAGARSGIDVLSGKHGGQCVRDARVFEGQ